MNILIMSYVEQKGFRGSFGRALPIAVIVTLTLKMGNPALCKLDNLLSLRFEQRYLGRASAVISSIIRSLLRISSDFVANRGKRGR